MKDYTKQLNDILHLFLSDMSNAPFPYPEIIWDKEELKDVENVHEVYNVQHLTFTQFKYIVERVMIDTQMNHIKSAQFVAQNINKLWQTHK